ncbi:ankyrin repeat-containing protein BDA1-like [Camellia sinensis]|uniref:PGG domain-containing protein n=1 Tax=Camellia sinensis var. sinensis TaxID=542762 RepID=A0A4S4EPN2_CAMSN|nr:ankyrin repeat-containing protein BDA1-like [Camellia sinensis]THG18701.1 hypothetical protein TEA_028324 [Camellia sinensis var. sinensis]
MDQRLHEAAIQGDVIILHQIVKEDPLVLHRVNSGWFGGSPLHVAALYGHADFVTEVLHLNPELTEVLDSSQHSALHLASAKGHVKIAQTLISANPDICLARDKDGRNPLHLAVMKGKVDVLKVLVQACPHAAQVTMDRGETIVHLCVMHDQLDSLKQLVNTIKSKEFVEAKDGRGNTILHLAVANKQIEVLKYLLTNATVDVNLANASGYTALDIFAQIRKDMKISDNIIDSMEDELQKAGAIRGKDLTWVQWLPKKKETLMVVASLIATIAFQAGVTPPGGVWQDNSNGHIAGEAVMAYNFPELFPHFLRANTMGFVTSLSTIMLLTSGLPFKRKIFVCILVVLMWLTITSMAGAYAISIIVIAPKIYKTSLGHTTVIALTVWYSLMTILLLAQMVRLIGKAFEEEHSRHLVAKRIQKFSTVKSLLRHLNGSSNSVQLSHTNV